MFDVRRTPDRLRRGSVSIETVLVIGALVLPILIFLLMFVLPRTQGQFGGRVDDLRSDDERQAAQAAELNRGASPSAANGTPANGTRATRANDGRGAGTTSSQPRGSTGSSWFSIPTLLIVAIVGVLALLLVIRIVASGKRSSAGRDANSEEAAPLTEADISDW